MGDFTAGNLDVLIATTVIEVGVDVPNATVMVVEHAERFGLAQLHQLRGRVGRGEDPSTAVFVTGDRPGETARQRLAVLEQTTDGFRIAEEDLRIRGPGDFRGTRQWGLPMFRVADLMEDSDFLQRAREEARATRDRTIPGSPEHVALSRSACAAGSGPRAARSGSSGGWRPPRRARIRPARPSSRRCG